MEHSQPTGKENTNPCCGIEKSVMISSPETSEKSKQSYDSKIDFQLQQNFQKDDKDKSNRANENHKV